MNFPLRVLGTCLVAFVAAGCDSGEKSAAPSPAAAASGPLHVAVSNYPMKYFTERIGGAETDVIYLVPKDADPAFWNPTPEQVRKIQEADLIVFNGASYEKWAPTVTLPEAKIVDTSAAFQDKQLKIANAMTHTHGPGGTHSHAGTDFNTWFDQSQALQQAEAIEKALAKKRPASAKKFEENFAALKSDLQILDKDLETATTKFGNTPAMASHPIYGYFARRYHLNLKHVQWEPEEMPSDAQWAELKGILATHPAKIMIWEGEPAPEIAAKLKEYGLTGCPVIPVGNTPDEGDYLSIWKANAQRLSAAGDAK